MSKPVDDLIEQFRKHLDKLDDTARSRYSIGEKHELFHAEDPAHVRDVIQLKYLADAGHHKAMVLYAKLCFGGIYIPENKVKAFKLISQLLEKLPRELSGDALLEFLQDYLLDGFAGKVITYRYQHQYGTAFGHKVWTWTNQARLNFTRMTIIAKLGVLELVRKHPAYAALAFGIFFVRIFYDLGVCAYSFIRDTKKREMLAIVYGTGRGNWQWIKRFINKDSRPLRYLNDIVWAALGITGFVLDMVGIGGYAAAVPLVLGFLFDVGVELFRAIKQYKTYTAEIHYLREKIEENDLEKKKFKRVDLEKQISSCNVRLDLEKQISDCNVDALTALTALKAELNEELEKCINEIQAIERDLPKHNAQMKMFDDRIKELQRERKREAYHSAFVVTATALLFVGMFIGRIIPLAISIDPMIGLGLVFAASAAILLHKLILSISDYKKQKLKEKILDAAEVNNVLMIKALDLSEHRLVDLEIIDSLKENKFPLNEKHSFFNRKKAAGRVLDTNHDFNNPLDNGMMVATR